MRFPRKYWFSIVLNNDDQTPQSTALMGLAADHQSFLSMGRSAVTSWLSQARNIRRSQLMTELDRRVEMDGYCWRNSTGGWTWTSIACWRNSTGGWTWTGIVDGTRQEEDGHGRALLTELNRRMDTDRYCWRNSTGGWTRTRIVDGTRKEDGHGRVGYCG